METRAYHPDSDAMAKERQDRTSNWVTNWFVPIQSPIESRYYETKRPTGYQLTSSHRGVTPLRVAKPMSII